MRIERGRIINDFIEPNKKQYIIPVYQRNYEWSKEQCVKLFEDIVKQLVHWSQNVMFSYNKDKVYGEYTIKDTAIYESVGFSASHIMWIIQALLDKYDIDRSEFIYSARAYTKSEENE